MYSSSLNAWIFASKVANVNSILHADVGMKGGISGKNCLLKSKHTGVL